MFTHHRMKWEKVAHCRGRNWSRSHRLSPTRTGLRERLSADSVAVRSLRSGLIRELGEGLGEFTIQGHSDHCCYRVCDTGRRNKALESGCACVAGKRRRVADDDRVVLVRHSACNLGNYIKRGGERGSR